MPAAMVGAEQAATAARERFRRFYDSDEGRKILYAILVADLGIFREATTQEEVALKNYACYFVREHLGLMEAHDGVAMVGEILKHGK